MDGQMDGKKDEMMRRLKERQKEGGREGRRKGFLRSREKNRSWPDDLRAHSKRRHQGDLWPCSCTLPESWGSGPS